jgi:hypothetical protein
MLELKAHALFAQVDELAPVVPAKEHEHHPLQSCPAAGAPLVFVFVNCLGS